MTTEPRFIDSDNNLLFKWCKKLSDANGGLHSPQPGDSNNNLLRKILSLYNL